MLFFFAPWAIDSIYYAYFVPRILMKVCVLGINQGETEQTVDPKHIDIQCAVTKPYCVYTKFVLPMISAMND